jgi:hypothetical protein
MQQHAKAAAGRGRVAGLRLQQVAMEVRCAMGGGAELYPNVAGSWANLALFCSQTIQVPPSSCIATLPKLTTLSSPLRGSQLSLMLSSRMARTGDCPAASL